MCDVTSLRTELDPDSRPPKNAMQRVANIIHKLYKWTKTPEALVSCALYIVVLY